MKRVRIAISMPTDLTKQNDKEVEEVEEAENQYNSGNYSNI